MKKLFKVSFLLFATLIFVSATNYITVITTDSEILQKLQNSSQNISLKRNFNFSMIFVEDRKVVRYLQLGNHGDALITSNYNLCKSLSEKGLASEEFSLFLKSPVYCTQNLIKTSNMFVILPEKYTHTSMENFTQIANNLNASIYLLEKNENTYETIVLMLKNNTNVCGFLSLFQNIGLKQSNLFKTQEHISYYACHVIGLNAEGYKTLIKN